MKTWYKSWFDSPFYHILYKDRDHKEARNFIDHLIAFLKPEPGSRMLDQACGKGRHAKYLHSLGFDVTGIDLSPQSIKYCKRYETDQLEFYVQDMRNVFRINYFDYVFNLFTSFGYFDTDHQNQLTIDSAASSLKKGGRFILDFMNSAKVSENLEGETMLVRDEIIFNIRKKIENGFIIKIISFSHEGQDYSFVENVEILDLDDFERYFRHAGLKTISLFGNYSLESFDRKNSDRLIIVAEKN